MILIMKRLEFELETEHRDPKSFPGTVRSNNKNQVSCGELGRRAMPGIVVGLAFRARDGLLHVEREAGNGRGCKSHYWPAMLIADSSYADCTNDELEPEKKL